MDEARQRIVVGIDGSDGARAALVWALTEAAARSAPVEVVTAFPVDFYWTDAYLLDTRRIEAIRADTEARSRSGCCTASWPTPRPTTRSSAAGRALLSRATTVRRPNRRRRWPTPPRPLRR